MAISRSAALITLLAAEFSASCGDVTPPPVPPFPTSFVSKPYVVVRMLMGKELENLLGPSGLSNTTVQVEVWHPNKELAESLRDDIRDYLLSFTGATTGQTIAAVNHGTDAELYDGVRELHELVTRVLIWWTL